MAIIVIVFVSFIGLLTLAVNLFRLLSRAHTTFFRPPKDLITAYGSWALVTGATDGIGKSLVFELASRGLNIVLVGRSTTKLESTSKEISERHGDKIGIRCIEVDLGGTTGEEIERRVREGIEGLDIGILVNNAGVAVKHATFFDEQKMEDVESVMKVNVVGATWMTRAVVGEMMKRRRGAVVNMGSGSAVVLPSYPLSAVYGATKAYIAMFSKCLSLEYKQYGIDVQCQIPMLVATKMTRIRSSSFFIPSTEEFSEASARCIGYDHLCQPYWTHAVEAYLLGFLPDAIANKIVLGHNLAKRKKALQLGYLKPKQYQTNGKDQS
ncbi:Very-long-chain 3-oxoacyl-CoA reductase 1-like protein [Drosera capensis]